MERFNPHMLTLAREARGLTQVELAGMLPFAQATLSKYETGFLRPPSEALSDLSSALGFPATFFMQEGRPYGFPPFHYRKRKKLSAKIFGRVIAEMNIRRLQLQRLLLSYDLRPQAMIPEIDPDEYTGRSRRRPDMEEMARAVREAWMLPRGPVPNMVELLENAGGVVIPCDFGTDLLDAMSQRIDGLPVMFFINLRASSDRIRWTLAHELAHMVLHTVALKDDETMENEADNFAGAFMLPEDEMKIHTRYFDLRHLANMKSYWKISMQAIACRADHLKLITPYQSKMFWTEMSRLGYRKREPNEPAQEKPKLLERMIQFHRRALGYSTAELAELLFLTVPEFEQTYAELPENSGDTSKREHLRVVK